MSIDYGIMIKLNIKHTRENISNILAHGTEKNFFYYDHVIAKIYDEAPMLDTQGATNKVIKALEEKIDGGPSVYAYLGDNSYAHLWFYKCDDGLLKFGMGAFSAPKTKEGFIDFGYYLRMCLDLCEDFSIAEMHTEEY